MRFTWAEFIVIACCLLCWLIPSGAAAFIAAMIGIAAAGVSIEQRD